MAQGSVAKQPRVWLVWHPHQKLWNWRLDSAVRRLGRRIGIRKANEALIFADSTLLLARIVLQRVRELGPRQAVRFADAPTDRVLYVDCGVHRLGRQLRFVDAWFAARCDLHMVGFEASGEHWHEAAANLADLRGLDLRHLALVGPDAPAGPVKLFKSGGEGKADSIYREQASVVTPEPRYEVVPAERLSDVLRRDFGSWLDEVPVLLRMNIEGAEYDVIEDLVHSGLAPLIDGYYGMWDDTSKFDPNKDRRFRRMVKQAGIRTVTFNDRDLSHRPRRLAIRLALDLGIRRGRKRKRAKAATPATPGAK